ncbi:MAG: ribosome biogenesis GTP-binding protein YihA/YsxC [Clostridia bacterium]|nr:ribosome biogenesis GTP-binding protein YihA/YsxC [Clostridia bacterium]
MKKRKLFYGVNGWVGLVGVIIGAGLLAFSVWYLSTTILLDINYVRTEATVVDVAEVRVNHPGEVTKTLYAEVVEFTVDGITYTAQNNSSSTAPKKVGSKMTVAYNPENPRECFFPSSNYSVVPVLFVLAAGFLAAGIFCLCLDVKEKRMNKYENAKFITSAASPSQFLKTDKPIIAISGRSNVGKSSFINLLAGRKQLARVSKEPGRTRLINYFDYGDFILADLPGYGYAKVSKEEKLKWAHLLDEFFAEEGHICHVLALVDSRHEPTADDIQMVEFLYSKIIPFTVIATKADKISKAEGARSKVRIAAALKCGADDVILTSSQKRTGLESVIKRLQNVITYGEENA